MAGARTSGYVDRRAAFTAAGAWFLVPIGTTLSEAWWPAWGMMWPALLVAGALMIVLAYRATLPGRSAAVWAGLGLLTLGLTVSLVAAWAVPVWTAAYGLGMLLATTGSRFRLPGWITGASLVAATALFFALTWMQVGTPDEYGDYPVAWVAATCIGALGAAAGMVLWARETAGLPTPAEATLG
ncbi:MAG: hypothetical protein R6X29_10165 [Acidimicrobiia bacterium]|jgi:hypothetical protein